MGMAMPHNPGGGMVMWWVCTGNLGSQRVEKKTEPSRPEDMTPSLIWGTRGGASGAQCTGWWDFGTEKIQRPGPCAWPLVKARLITGFQKYQWIKGNVPRKFGGWWIPGPLELNGTVIKNFVISL